MPGVHPVRRLIKPALPLVERGALHDDNRGDRTQRSQLRHTEDS